MIYVSFSVLHFRVQFEQMFVFSEKELFTVRKIS